MTLEIKNHQNKIKLSELNDKELLKLILHLYDNKKFEEVVRITNKIFLKTSDQYWIHFLKGSSLYNLGSYEEAIVDYEKCLEINPNSAESYFELGNIYQNTKKTHEAETYYNLAISKKENYVEAIANLGKLYKDIGDFNKSREYLENAIEINPNFPRAFNFLGSLADAQNDIKNAEKFYKKAIYLDNSYDEPIYNLALVQLYDCQFKEGFRNHDYRWKISSFVKKKLHTNQPLWSPSKNNNNHLTIWPEQGIGDYILYSRFFNDIIHETKNFTVVVHEKTKALFERSFPHINFVTEINTGNIDYHLPIGDLAKFYVNSLNDIKTRSDIYLKVDKNRSDMIKGILPKGNKICGISWISKNDDIGENKSMSLEDMKDLLMLPNVTFVDLQYTDTTEERNEFKNKYGIEILKFEEIDNFNDIDGLASLINACDCIVTISNTNVHIAGSIGKKTFLMLPKGKGRLWYWSKENTQSIWYKSIEIVEQDIIGSWNDVIEKIKSKLSKHNFKPKSLEIELGILINLFKKGYFQEVIEKGERLKSYFNKSHMLYNVIGSAYSKIKNFEKARYYHEISTKLKPNFHEGYYNLGYTYWELGELDKAEKNCLRSLELKSNYAFPYNTLGAVYQDKVENNKAEKYFKKAIELDNNYLKPKYNLYLHYAHIGNFKEAWKYFEHRWKALDVHNEVNKLSGTRWNLKLSNSVTIWAEQGIGDFILYSRFFNDLITLGIHFRVLIDKKLISIFERTFPNVEFVTELNKSQLDFHAPLGDLAKFFINSFNDVRKRSDAYLKVDKNKSKLIKEILPKGKKICGISWISKNESLGKNKSITLEDMKDLLMLPNITFVDLQYTDTTEERNEFKKKYGIDIHRFEQIDNFNDIDGLASLIDACDFVVSVSNTTVHIAGSIGKKTYLMLPNNRGKLWYWSKENAQSIWYKSIEIFERNTSESWKNLIQKIIQKLEKGNLCT